MAETNNIVYVILYINVDKPEYSETLGVFFDKEKAVDKLLEKANYRNNNGKLTYYMKPSYEYDSYESLRLKVSEQLELIDLDIYRINKLRIY